jgi:hypothetical protein
MASTGNRLRFEAIREVAYGDITASYTQMGAAFGGPLRFIYITNQTDSILYFSVDGSENHLKLIPGDFRLFDLKTNETFLDNLQTVYLKYSGAAPESGYAAIECGVA